MGRMMMAPVVAVATTTAMLILLLLLSVSFLPPDHSLAMGFGNRGGGGGGGGGRLLLLLCRHQPCGVRTLCLDSGEVLRPSSSPGMLCKKRKRRSELLLFPLLVVPSFPPSDDTNSSSSSSSSSGEEEEEEEVDDNHTVVDAACSLQLQLQLLERDIDHLKREMTLLANLNQGDRPAISNLRDHWFSERGNGDSDGDGDGDGGHKMKSRLLEADNAIGRGPTKWVEAQDVLESLLDADPTFIEARARYAKLLCLQGSLQWDEAEHHALMVLDAKPWHFVTLETMVAISAGRGDVQALQMYTSRRLPPPSRTADRAEWVDRALGDAETMLGRMQERRRRLLLLLNQQQQQDDPNETDPSGNGNGDGGSTE